MALIGLDTQEELRQIAVWPGDLQVAVQQAQGSTGQR
jgi:hypothetical protein